jgi:CheY-like chemotaxis protein
MSILVVDDEASVRAMLIALLEDARYDARGAANGREAIARLRAEPARYRLILLDVMMPFLSGWDVLLAIHSDPALANIPIVMMTAGASVREQALDLGAAGYVSKPLDLDLLLDLVEQHYPNPADQPPQPPQPPSP